VHCGRHVWSIHVAVPTGRGHCIWVRSVSCRKRPNATAMQTIHMKTMLPALCNLLFAFVRVREGRGQDLISVHIRWRFPVGNCIVNVLQNCEAQFSQEEDLRPHYVDEIVQSSVHQMSLGAFFEHAYIAGKTIARNLAWSTFLQIFGQILANLRLHFWHFCPHQCQETLSKRYHTFTLIAQYCPCVFHFHLVRALVRCGRPTTYKGVEFVI